MGIGAPAEYDGFSGIVFNTVTKSGGNTFSGLADAWIQPKKWNSSNTDDPSLTPSFAALYNVHFDIGGPVIRDKLWFFFGSQFYHSEQWATGFPYATTYNQPRFFLKLTWQASKSDRLNLALEQDWYQGKYRQSSKYHAPEATRKQDSPEFYYNFSLLHVFSDRTFFEAKAGGFISKYLLIPMMGYDIPGHYDYVTLMYTVNRSTYYHAYRNRYSFNASVNHHAEDFIKGSHDFKFGLDGEINPTRTEYVRERQNPNQPRHPLQPLPWQPDRRGHGIQAPDWHCTPHRHHLRYFRRPFHGPEIPLRQILRQHHHDALYEDGSQTRLYRPANERRWGNLV
jgi:hypothetical protein